jgi:HD-like signal output (HDOD) protein
MADLSTLLLTARLPVMPEVAQALIRTLNDENADITTVRDVIAKDPALTTTLLRMANSAVFGLSRSVTTLENAVSMVGMSQIRARALSVCMANVFSLPPGMNRLQFWQQSMKCAGYARWLAMSKGLDENLAWLTGIMLRLGETVVAQTSPGKVADLEAQPCSAPDRWDREHTLAGFDEGQIMAEIARRWDFPQVMVQALESCAHPLEAATFSPLGGVVHLAALLTEKPLVTTETLAELPEGVVQKIGLNLLWMSIHLPNADAFVDTTVLQH